MAKVLNARSYSWLRLFYSTTLAVLAWLAHASFVKDRPPTTVTISLLSAYITFNERLQKLSYHRASASQRLCHCSR